MKGSINGVHVHICFTNLSQSTMISIWWQTGLWFTNNRVRRTHPAIFGRCTIFLITQIRLDSRARSNFAGNDPWDLNGDFCRVTVDFGVYGGLMGALGGGEYQWTMQKCLTRRVLSRCPVTFEQNRSKKHEHNFQQRCLPFSAVFDQKF